MEDRELRMKPKANPAFSSIFLWQGVAAPPEL
jgi:hypothetical protein